ncbi:MAG: nitroreductase family protein [Candidatus Bathyarchaeota archaeon]|jgi:nitroreductase
MEFYEVIKTRRSVRSYSPMKPDDESLQRVLEATRLAPSGSNRQPWRFIIVTDAEKRAKLQEACGNQRFVGAAPAVVVACGYDVKYNRGGYMGEMAFLVDVSIAFTHLILAARAEGLGTCWIGDFKNGAIKELLGIPEDWDVVAVTPLGYPEGDPFKETGRRKPLDEITSEESF